MIFLSDSPKYNIMDEEEISGDSNSIQRPYTVIFTISLPVKFKTPFVLTILNAVSILLIQIDITPWGSTITDVNNNIVLLLLTLEINANGSISEPSDV